MKRGFTFACCEESMLKISFILVILIMIIVLSGGCQTSPKWSHYRGGSNPAYPGENWQKAEIPEQLGWSSQKLTEARAYSKKIGSAAVMIVQDGVVVDAWGNITRNFKCHSMRKSILSALIGVHVSEGNMDLTKTMEELGIDDYEPSLTMEEKQATVGDLIKARSGIYHPALGESAGMKAMRPKRHSHAPGTFWYYNNWDFNALGTIFEQETGTKIFEEFDQRFAKPLQLEDFKVDSCRYRTSDDYAEGLVSKHRYYFFRMSARDLARFGLLFLHEGRWRDQQIISTEWVHESTASYSQRGVDGGYGYMWWTGINGGLFQNVMVKGHSYYASGWGGHKVIVLPYRNLVIVHRVNTDRPGKRVATHQIGRLLWHILDAAGEADIGDSPALDAAVGNQLDTDRLRKLLEKGGKWIGDNSGIFPG
jgi:CubicO group peptidase (beta-lactamase class C family)